MKARVTIGSCLVVLILWSVGTLADQQDDDRFNDVAYNDYMTGDQTTDLRESDSDDDQQMDQMDFQKQQDLDSINDQDDQERLDDQQEMTDNHIRTRRGLRSKLRKKFAKIKHKVNKVIGPRGSSQRKLVEAAAARFLG